MGPPNPPRTAHFVDSVTQKVNAALAKSSSTSTLVVKVRHTITRSDTVIHELKYQFQNPGLVAQQAKLATFIGKPLPEFALPDLAGKMVRAKSLRGQPAVLNLWFTACAPCIGEMPALNKIQAEKASASVAFLALTYDNRAKVRAFLPKHPFTFRHLPNAQAYCAQFISSYPISIFVDRTGIIRRIEGGMWQSNEKGEGHADEGDFRYALEEVKTP